jgi:UDP-N-acetylmuramoylalanine--D-glutamate ligase
MDDNFLSGKTVLVMGLGRFGGGVDAAKFATGKDAKVVVTDLAGADELAASLAQLSAYPDIEYHLGGHREDDFENADIVIANPAVPLQNKFLKIAASCAHFVTSQMGIFFELCPATIIGITGTNGKSTTAALTAHLLSSANKTDYGRVQLSGNIGNEPLLTILDEIEAHDLIVLELSSFQIEQLAAEQKATQVAMLTNLLPNHLDRYGTFEKYSAAKKLLFDHQKLEQDRPAVSIFNREDAVAARWYEKYREQPGRRCLTYSADDVPSGVHRRFNLPGRCNLSNLAGAMTIAGLFGVDETAVADCISDFEALPHRLQFIAEHNEVRWFNDSKATTPESAVAALEAFEEPVVLITGGYDKKLPFDQLGLTIAGRARAVILIGETAEKIKAAVEAAPCAKKVAIEPCESLTDAVETANRTARAGDVVLLSPACASYDMFDNYEQRGRDFVRLVHQLTH